MLTLGDIFGSVEVQGSNRIKVFDEQLQDYCVDIPMTDKAKQKYADYFVQYIYPKGGGVVFEVTEDIWC